MTVVPPGCADRLLRHYGPGVGPWLRDAPRRIEAACRRWNVEFIDYHDAGHASAIVLVRDMQGGDAIMKAWPDPARCATETEALSIWYQEDLVREVDRNLCVALITMVGGRPGGDEPRTREVDLVAAAIRHVHASWRGGQTGPTFPELSTYVAETILPRIARRAEEQESCSSVTAAHAVLQRGLPTDARRTVLLHGDLYRENTLFDRDGAPVLADPLPMVGDSVFDWAFWIVYYTLGTGTADRITLAKRTSGIEADSLFRWCLLLCLDGFLFYRETSDPRTSTMESVMESVLARIELRA